MGGSKLPLDTLRTVDVDLETTTPMKQALDYYEKLIIEFETLIK